MFSAYIIKKRYMLIIDGHDVYEIDEECIKKHRVKGECKVLEKLKEKEQHRQKKSPKWLRTGQFVLCIA